MRSTSDPLKPYRLYFAMLILNLAVVVGVIYAFQREPAHPLVITAPPTRAAKLDTAARITVSVSGAVKQPGDVSLENDAPLAAALQQAGGVTADADLSKFDLTRPLRDGDKISVPTKIAQRATSEFNPTRAPSAPMPTSAISPSTKLNLNTATLQELEQLPGIGRTLAERILEYRAQHGGFKTIDELTRVKGIGASLFNQIKELITVQ